MNNKRKIFARRKQKIINKLHRMQTVGVAVILQCVIAEIYQENMAPYYSLQGNVFVIYII